jgi:protein phosphatase
MADADAASEPESRRRPLIVVEVAARSDVGCVRERNEDSFVVADLTAGKRELAALARHEAGERGTLFVVCDGMGGAAAGEVASGLAVEVMFAEMTAAAPSQGDRAVFARLLRRSVRTANRRLHEEARKNPRHRGMGTTLSAAGLAGDALVLAQVGDSRAYIYRSGVLTQVTRDQSVVSALLHAGRLTPEEAKNYAHSNVILQALGVADDVEVSLSIVELRRGDVLLMCSDGLHGPVPDDLLSNALARGGDLDLIAQDLIERARQAGGPDNITAILARFGGDALPEPKNEEDLPKFVEFDPAEEGERSFTTTSRVARRLAARAGVGEETSHSGPRPLPPTGQHRALSDEDLERAARRSIGADPAQPNDARFSPATAAVRHGSRLGAIGWILAIIAIIALVALLVWR